MHDQVRILKSPSDVREYKALRLSNGLSAILIHDPDIKLNGDEIDGDGRHFQATSMHAVPDDGHASSLEDRASVEEEGTETDESDTSQSEDGSDDENQGHIRSKQPHVAHAHGGLKKAAAALSVGVGHYSDPPNLQGLSHYLEHMLFMGSEKYPDENEYDAFLSAHSGSSNAYTEEEATTFHFDCAPASLEQALDRLAQFFVCPLFKRDAMEREVIAVDNEFTGVLQSDQCRLLQLRAHTAKDGHPARGFGWGNSKSLVDKPNLSGTNVRDALLQHYAEQYSAERMNLVVIGAQPLSVLESWVCEKFSSVLGGKGVRTSYKEFGKPFVPGESCGKLYILPSVRDEHRMSIVFQFPDLQAYYFKKAEDYVSHLLGHEGYGSLLAGLKSRGWATALSAGTVDQTSAAWLFEIAITLTEAGLLADQGYGMSPVGLVFEYISMLKSMEPQKWAWDELKAISDMKWQFLEEEEAADYVAQIASDMHIYPVEHALAGSYLHLDFDQGLINDLLAEMTPKLVRLELQTRDFEGCLSQAHTDERLQDITVGEEPWFSFPFASCALPPNLVEQWDACTWSTDLQLPPRNPYLPTNFDIICDNNYNQVMEGGEDETDIWPSPPKQLLNARGLDLCHKLDSRFRKPRAFAYFRLSLPNTNISPRVAAMTHLVVKLLEDELCQEAYLADVADLHYGIAFEGAQGKFGILRVFFFNLNCPPNTLENQCFKIT